MNFRSLMVRPLLAQLARFWEFHFEIGSTIALPDGRCGSCWTLYDTLSSPSGNAALSPSGNAAGK
jgi:hypothetical protein